MHPADWDNRWRLPTSRADYLVVRAHAITHAEDERRRVPSVFVAALLDRWLGSSTARTLHDIYQALGGFLPLGLTSLERARYDKQLKERLTRAFELGELVAFEQERAHLLPPPRPPKPVMQPAPPEEEALDFLAIELLDEDDKPLAYQRYHVVLANGSERHGRLNANGHARVDNVLAGSCKVTFPDLDTATWS